MYNVYFGYSEWGSLFINMGLRTQYIKKYERTNKRVLLKVSTIRSNKFSDKIFTSIYIQICRQWHGITMPILTIVSIRFNMRTLRRNYSLLLKKCRVVKRFDFFCLRKNKYKKKISSKIEFRESWIYLCTQINLDCLNFYCFEQS